MDTGSEMLVYNCQYLDNYLKSLEPEGVRRGLVKYMF